MKKDDRIVGLPWVLWNFDDEGAQGAEGWTVLGNDTTNLAAITTRRVRGTRALEFDKANGGANTKLAGAYRTISMNLTQYTKPADEIGWHVYVSALTNVDYAFLRIGTSASHYVEYQVSAHEMTAGVFNYVHRPLYGYKSVAGNCVDWTNVDYLAVGVAFLVESDALADIVIDQIQIDPSVAGGDTHEDISLVVDGTSYQSEEGAVVSPDTNVGQTPVPLAVPHDAKFLHLRGSGAIRFGSNATLDGTDGDGYDYLPAQEPSGPIPVLDGTTIYVRNHADTGDVTVWHRWEKRTG